MTFPLLFLACALPEPGLLFGEERLPVVDAHLHIHEWGATTEETQAELGEQFPFPFSMDPKLLTTALYSAPGAVDQMDRAGISQGVLYSLYAPHSLGVLSNEVIYGSVISEPGRLWGMASVRVDRWESEEEDQLDLLELLLLQDEILGVHLSPTHQHFRLDDERIYSVYELAGELGKPVHIRLGIYDDPGLETSAPYTDPAYLEELLRSFPQTDFILGQLGYDFVTGDLAGLETSLTLARKYENLTLEIGGLSSEEADPSGRNFSTLLKQILEEGLEDRVFYGSDGIQRHGYMKDHLERAGEAAAFSGWTEDQMEDLLSGNFVRYFELPEVEL